VDRKTTVQPLQDYTLREKEIHGKGKKLSSVPRRLKAAGVLLLVEKMQKLHQSCPYHALVKHYCPASVSHFYTHFRAYEEYRA